MDSKTLNERLTLIEQAKQEARQAMTVLSQKYGELQAHLNALEGASIEVKYWLSQTPMELSELAEKLGADSIELVKEPVYSESETEVYDADGTANE